ncbi:MAG TPA: LemA family protein [Candidatus Nanoarchaeia archaeon]|nr:LemA family protein [Candidatus Nanoarchaeia archaeon]
MSLLWIILGIVALLGLYLIFSYNRLIVLRNRIDNAWSQIDVQLKRRTDLIPNLIATVKGYAKHEKSLLENITKARSAIMKAPSLAAKAKADNVLSGALKSLFAVAENYPQLRANENFLQLQEELSGTESKIAYARQFFNDAVLDFNNLLQRFPTNMIGGWLKFTPREFFKVPEHERKNVKVSF